jgi:hypothetical protein
MLRRDPEAVGVRADGGIASVVTAALIGRISARWNQLDVRWNPPGGRQQEIGAPAKLDAP